MAHNIVADNLCCFSRLDSWNEGQPCEHSIHLGERMHADHAAILFTGDPLNDSESPGVVLV